MTYKYKEFDEWFKHAAKYLWNVKQWDNAKIKDWLEAAFEDSRALQLEKPKTAPSDANKDAASQAPIH